MISFLCLFPFNLKFKLFNAAYKLISIIISYNEDDKGRFKKANDGITMNLSLPS